MYDSIIFEHEDQLTDFLNTNAVTRDEIVTISYSADGISEKKSILLVYETRNGNIDPIKPCMTDFERVTNVMATMAKCGLSIDDINDMMRTMRFN